MYVTLCLAFLFKYQQHSNTGTSALRAENNRPIHHKIFDFSTRIKILDKLNHELHDVEHEREEQDSMIEKNQSKALSELRAVREKLDLVIESRVKKLQQILLGRSSSTKSSKLSVDSLLYPRQKFLLRLMMKMVTQKHPISTRLS